VKNTDRKKLVIAALWSEMCLAQPAIHAMGLTGTSLDVD